MGFRLRTTTPRAIRGCWIIPACAFFWRMTSGAGKTIMAGLTIREMLLRRLVQRILVVSPAGLVGNWEAD